MRLSSVSIAAFILGILASPLVVATTMTADFYWTGGENIHERAATCTISYSVTMPLTIPRTFVADSSFEVGDVIYSWDYANFMPNYLQSRCIPDTESDYPYSTMTGAYSMTELSTSNTNVNGVIPTSLDGVGIRLFYKIDTTTDGTNGGLYTDDNLHGHLENSSIAERILFNNNPYHNIMIGCEAGIRPSSNKYILGCDYSISVRAELVKTGPISVGSLSVPDLIDDLLIKWPSEQIHTNRNSFSGSAVTLVAPACQLKNANYTVSMGDFIPLFTSRRGANVPVNLDLECSGQVNNVNFRFEDTGTSPSTGLEKNVSLYSSQGTLVNGLEIEMRYEGERVNIDGATEHSTGSHGQRKTVADSTPLFDSESTASFTANYLQTGPVLSGGNAFTGAINGKVNMWVTYN